MTMMQLCNSLTQFVADLRCRRGMFLPASDADPYSQVVAALIGFDQATHGGALAGFREWLVVKHGGLGNLAWFAIVDKETSLRRIGDADDRVTFLLDMVQEYLLDRDRKGMGRLFYEYYDWQKRQEGTDDSDG